MIFVVMNFLIILLGQPFIVSNDSVSYFTTGLFLAGEPGGVLQPHRILKPLGPYLAYRAGEVMGIGIERGLIAINILFYVLSAWTCWMLFRRLLREPAGAFFASVLYLGGYPLLLYGITYLTDMGAWFWNLAAIFFIVQYVETRRRGDAFLAGLATGVGLLWKEYAVVPALVFLILLITDARLIWRERIKALTFFCVPIAFTFLVWQVCIWLAYGVTYASWYQTGGVSHYKWRDVPFIFKSLAGVFLAGWALVYPGYRLIREKGSAFARRFVCILLPASLVFLFWQSVSSRLYFVAAVPLSLFAGAYLGDLYARHSRWAWLLTCVVIAINYLWFFGGDLVRPLVWPWYQI